MPTVRQLVRPVLIRWAIKTVTATDKNKAAYVLTNEQAAVLRASGLKLVVTGQPPITRISVIGEARESVEASYYLSARSEIANRPPEPRMGRELISTWLHKGDDLLLGTDGKTLFAARNPNTELTGPAAEQIEDRFYRRVSDQRLRDIAPKPGQVVGRLSRTNLVFERSRAVVELALRRANNACETPGCRRELFKTDNGQNYLEVHHIMWLRDGGSDNLENVAAICPACHRECHHGEGRTSLARALEGAISSKSVRQS